MYKLQQNSILRLSDNASGILAVGNRDYDEYLVWVSEGNTPEPEFTDEELAEQLLATKIAEAKLYLNDTDHKELQRYKAKVGEDLDAIFAKRDEIRDFIRMNR